MKEYHKIQTVFLRDPETKFKTLLEGQFALPEFHYLKDNEWIFTEKVDGTNIRVIWNGKEMSFAGKTDRAEIPSHLRNALNEQFLSNKRQEAFQQTFKDSLDTSICLYGEGYGYKIQKGGKYLPKTCSFALFDVKIGDWWLQRKDVEDVAYKMVIDLCPVIGRGALQEMIDLVKCGFNSRWGDFTAEGIVARPKIELKTRNGKRIITKLKHKDFPKGD